MSGTPLATFLRDHRAMHLASTDKPLPPALLERLHLGQRLALVRDGHVVGAVVTVEDLQLLELTDHGLSVVEEASL